MAVDAADLIGGDLDRRALHDWRRPRCGPRPGCSACCGRWPRRSTGRRRCRSCRPGCRRRTCSRCCPARRPARGPARSGRSRRRRGHRRTRWRRCGCTARHDVVDLVDRLGDRHRDVHAERADGRGDGDGTATAVAVIAGTPTVVPASAETVTPPPPVTVAPSMRASTWSASVFFDDAPGAGQADAHGAGRHGEREADGDDGGLDRDDRAGVDGHRAARRRRRWWRRRSRPGCRRGPRSRRRRRRPTGTARRSRPPPTEPPNVPGPDAGRSPSPVVAGGRRRCRRWP